MKTRPELVRKLSIVAVLLLLGTALIWYSGIATIESSNIIIRNQGVKLAGTLAMPRWSDEAVPAIVIVHGSGRVRRDGIQSFVRELVPKGFAVLTFDKRGVGKSMGVFTRVTVANSEERLREMASDVSAAVNHLAEHEGIDPERIALVGSNQAGWIMPLVANENRNVSNFVSISGVAVTVGQAEYFKQLVDEAEPQSNIMADYNAFEGPHGFDPLASLMNVQVPSLWLIGEQSARVPVTSTQHILTTLPTAELFDVRLIPNLDHDLRDVDSGADYDYWAAIVEWLSS